MNAKLAALAVLVAAVTLTSVASAGPGAAKQRVALTVTILPSGKGVLEPLQTGTLARNAGTFSGNWSQSPTRTVIRSGQQVDIHNNTWTFTGKQGTLVLGERVEAVDLGQDLDHNNFQDGIGMGAWQVKRGKGLYAGITGVGRSAHFYQGNRWVARYEGFLTVPKD